MNMTCFRCIPTSHERFWLANIIIIFLVMTLSFFLESQKHCKFFFWKIIYNIWDKLFKDGQSKICGRQPLKNFEGVWSALGIPYPFKFFKGCLPQILLGPFLNPLPHLIMTDLRSSQNGWLERWNQLFMWDAIIFGESHKTWVIKRLRGFVLWSKKGFLHWICNHI